MNKMKKIQAKCYPDKALDVKSNRLSELSAPTVHTIYKTWKYTELKIQQNSP